MAAGASAGYPLFGVFEDDVVPAAGLLEARPGPGSGPGTGPGPSREGGG